MRLSPVDILMIGNFAKDKLIVDNREQIASGGGVYYGSVVIQRLGLCTAVVTRLHPDDFPRLEELRSEGVTVFATAAEGTSGIANYYQSSDMERRICKPIGFGGKFSIKEIPEIPTRAIMVTPLFSGEIDLNLLQELASRAPLALDIQGFVRVPFGDDLIFQPWEQLSEGLKCVNWLKVDLAEAEYLTGQNNPRDAILKLTKMGPREIILTRSAGVMVFSNGDFYEAPFTPRSLKGRTGRGDTCFSSYIARRLDSSPAEACAWAGIITSLKQEVAGPWKGSPKDVSDIIINGYPGSGI